MLSRAGAQVQSAASAEQARKLLQTFLSPDLIISDIGMPEENGLEFIEKLRHSGSAVQAALPAIALTAYVRSEEKTRALRAGFQAPRG